MRHWTPERRARQNESWRRWYVKNRARKMLWQSRRNAELRAWFFELKAGKHCEKCGANHPAVLTFHHRDPREKDIEIATAVAKRWTRERILAEIEKCDVLCANCHMKLHAAERRARRIAKCGVTEADLLT